MGFSLYLGPFQPFLEEKLLSSIAAFRASHPHDPLRVVVPNLMLTRHLGVLGARQPRGMFNVRFQTLRHFLQDATEKSFMEEDARPAPESLMLFLLQQAAWKNKETLKSFGPVLETPGFIRALRDTLGDLQQAGWNPVLLRKVAAEQAKRHPASSVKWSAFASMAEDFARTKSARGWVDEGDRAERILRLSPKALGGIWVYGFYDATALQKRILLHLSGGPESRWFVPFRDVRAYEYARPFVDLIRPLAGKIEAYPEAAAASDRLTALRRNLFSPGFEAPDDAKDDKSLEIALCPGESGEMREAARAFASLGDDVNLGDCAVILRGANSYRRVLPLEFKSLGVAVEWHLHHSLLETPEGHAALLYLDCLAQGFPRALLSQWFSSPCLRPRFFGLNPERWDAPAWDALSLRSGVVEGLDQWKRRVGRFLDKAEGEETPLTTAASDLSRVLSKIGKMEKEFQGAKTWADKAQVLSAQLAQVFETSSAVNLLRSALDPIRNLRDWKEIASAADFARVMAEVWEGEKCRREDSTDGGVVVTDLMEARGVPFPYVVFPGLNEKIVPRPVRMDPLLPDTDRLALNDSTPPTPDSPRLALKGDGVLEERLLFALAVESARSRMWLTASSRDALTGESRVVSPYLEEAVRAVTGDIPRNLAGSFDFIRSLPSPPKIPTLLADCDRREDAFLFFLREQKNGDASWFLAAAKATPFFFEGRDLSWNRQVNRTFTPYDGMLTGPSALLALSRHYALDAQTLSASQLETYTACPLKYFFKYLLRLEVVPEPEAPLEMEAQEKGSLAHRVLETVFRKGKEEGWLQKRDKAAATECLVREAGALFSKAEEKGSTGSTALWHWHRERLLEDLRTVIEGVLDDREWLPSEFEADLAAGEGVSFPLDPGVSLRLKGRVDRVDVSSDGKRYRVVDYKTGSNQGFNKTKNRYYGGRKIQLPLYLWALKGRYPDKTGQEGIYDFLTRKGGYQKFFFRVDESDEVENSLRTILGAVARGVVEGRFPSSSRDCKHCDFKPLCGHAPETRAARKDGDPVLADFHGLETLL